jgi:hypothetical protein
VDADFIVILRAIELDRRDHQGPGSGGNLNGPRTGVQGGVHVAYTERTSTEPG